MLAFTASARKAFRKLPVEAQTRIRAAFARYAETGEGDVTRMQGMDGTRLRAGGYRAIFTKTADTIDIRAVGHRRDIYR